MNTKKRNPINGLLLLTEALDISTTTRLLAFVEPKRSAFRRKSAVGVLFAGILTLLAVGFIPRLAHAANGADTWVGNTSALFSGANWTGANNPPISLDSLVFGTAGSAGTALIADQTAGISYAGITFNSVAPSYTIGGANGITLTGNVANNSTSLETLNFPISAMAVRTFTMNTGTIMLGGNIGGSGGGMTTAGTGVLILSGTNSFTGVTKVGANTTLQLQANAGNTASGISYALGATALTMSGVNGSISTLQLRSDTSLTFNGGNNLGGLGGTGNGETVNIDVNQLTSSGLNNTLTFAPAGFGTLKTTFNITGGNGYTLALGPITTGNNGTLTFNVNSASLIINGGIPGIAGTLTFGGSFNSTVTGVIANGTSAALLTKTGAGTLTLNGAAASTYTGATTVNGGTLLEDFANATTPGSGLISSSSPLTLGGGALSIKGQNGANATAQTLGNLTLTASTSSGITLNPNGGPGTTFTLGSTWTRNANSVLNIDLSAGGTLSSTLAAATLGYATVKDATSTGLAQATGSGIVRLTGQTALPATGTSGTTDYILSGTSQTISPVGSFSVNSLTLDGTSGGGTLDLGDPSDVMTMTSLGLLMVGGNNYTIQDGQVGAANTETVIHTMGSGMLTINGTISSGTGSLTKDGNGMLVLGGANTYTGVTKVLAGTLTLSGNNTSATGLTTVNPNATLQLQANGGNTVSGVSYALGVNNLQLGAVNGSTSTLQLRSDTSLTFNGGNSMQGLGGANGAGETVNVDVNQLSLGTGNTLTFAPGGFATDNLIFNVTGGNGYTLAVGPVTTASSGFLTFNANSANLLISGGITNASTLTFSGGFNSTVSGVISTAATKLTKSGTGTLTLTAANTYTGATTISAGTLQLGNGGSLSASGAITDNGTFAINRTDAVAQGTDFSGTGITGTGGLNQTGGGTTTLTAANTYSGGTVLQAGTVQVSGINNLGSGNYGGVTFNGGTLQYAISATSAGSLDLSSGNGITLSSGGGTIDVNGNTVTYAGTIGHSGSGALTVASTAANGVLNLNGANTYTGATTVNSGATIGGTGSLAGALTLSSGANALMTANSPLTVSGAVTLNGNTFTTTVPLTTGTYTLLTGGSFAGGSTVNATPGAGSVAGGYNGVVSISGNSVRLTVTPVGTTATWTDGNADQKWSEAGNWSGGVPHLAGDSATFNSAGGSAVTLDANETISGITFNNSSSDVISGGNTLTLDGSGSGATATVSAGAANAISTSVALNDNTAIVVNSGKSLTLGGTVANGSNGSKTLTITGGGAAILSHANTYGPSAGSVGTTVGGATTVQVGNNTALGSGDVGVSGNSTIQAGAAGLIVANNLAIADVTTVDNNGNNLTLNGNITGGGGLTKTSAGALTLGGVNTYNGATTIGADTLVVGGAGQLGGGAYAGNIINNGALSYNSSAAQTLSGIISGSGALNENSSGSLTLSGANTFTNTTTIAAGTLTLANQNALQNNTLNYNGGSLTFSGITAATLGGLNGPANLSLVNDGTAAVTLTVGGNNSTTAFSGVLSDATAFSGFGALTMNGTGTLTLSGNETLTGALRVSGGTLVLSGDNSGRPTASANTTVVNNGGTLQLQANAGNTSGGTSTALSSEASVAALNLNNGSTVQLRSDSSVTFAGANNLGGIGSSTITFDVNQLTSAGTNNTLTFAPGGFNIYRTTFNVTGTNGYTLALGQLTDLNSGTSANPDVFNPATGNLSINGITFGSTNALGTTFVNLSGTSTGNSVIGVIGGGAGTIAVTKLGASMWTLSAANTYTGATTISAGTLQVDGSIAASAVAVNGGVLDGIGAIGGAVTVAPSGNLGAGDAGTNVGRLTINNNLTLQGNATLRINKTGGSLTNDQIAVNGNITYAGILTVSNITSDATALALGNTFPIFSVSGSSSGNFTSIVGSPGGGLAYSFNPTNGVLSVVTAAAPLSGLKFTASPVISGTSLTISATNSGAGTVYLLTSTNVAASLNTWTPVWTNVLSGSGSFTTNVSNAVNPASTQQFYILSNTNN